MFFFTEAGLQITLKCLCIHSKNLPHPVFQENCTRPKSLRFLVKGWLQNRYGDALYFCQLVKYVIHVYAVIETRPNFPYTKYGA